MSDFHERYGRPELQLPPDRSTGLVFATVAAIVAYFWRASPTVMWTALGIAMALVLVSFMRPLLLRPANILWMKFAHLLSRIMNPLVMLVLFAIAIVPTGLIMQLLRDPLGRKRSGVEVTYWIKRRDDPPPNMRNQF